MNMTMMIADMQRQIFVMVEASIQRENISNDIGNFSIEDSPSRMGWDDDDPDRRRSQWEYSTPNDGNYRHGHGKRRDTDYYNR